MTSSIILSYLKEAKLCPALNSRFNESAMPFFKRRDGGDKNASQSFFLARYKLLAWDFNPAAGLYGFIQLYLIGNGQILSRDIHW